MIIVGDIASPGKGYSSSLEELFEDNGEIFLNNTLLFNMEGLIADDHSTETDTPVLFSHSSLLRVLEEKCGNAVALLANNHTLDIPRYFGSTIDKLQRHNISFAGAGRSKSKSEEPVHFVEKGKDIYLFNYCWDFLLYHQKNPSENVYVAEIDESKIIKKIAEYRAAYPQASIVVYFHWSIDLEVLPYPMYRQFSKVLIDSGANIVAGCHSHCIQGGEKYRDGYIIYGLGNLFIPWNVYAGGDLEFPDFSKTAMGLEWDPVSHKARCHWFEYKEESKSVKFLETEPFEKSNRLSEYTPYRNISESEYVDYFKENRRKKFLIPIYTDYRKVWYNKWLNFLIKTRAKTARTLAKFNLINWQN